MAFKTSVTSTMMFILYFVRNLLSVIVFCFVVDGNMGDRAELAIWYHSLGLSYNEILAMLASHRIIVSKRTLHRILRSRYVYRRTNRFTCSQIDQVVPVIQRLFAQSGSLHGYRWFHARCVQEGLVISREVVRQILGIVDPDGVASRSARRLHRRQYFARGPNFIWHLDGYDKLKPYGLCIHACIDGYSRHIIWAKVFRTNNDPKVVASYYLDAVTETMAAPHRIRADRGTENGHIQAMHCMLVDNERSFIYGTNTANQRIESWWGILRRQCIQLWMDRFEELKDGLYFEGDFLDKALVQFCFSDVVQVCRACIESLIINKRK